MIQRVLGLGKQVEGDNNLLFGYNDVYRDFDSDTNAGAGTILKTLAAVPTGEIWVLQHVVAYNDTRGARILLRIKAGADRYDLKDETSAGAGVRVIWDGEIVMYPAEQIEVAFLGTIAADDLYWGARGYKMVVV